MNKLAKWLAGVSVFVAVTCPIFASTPQDFISVAVDGKVLYLDQAPVLQSGTTLVPMRAIFEALGATIKWDSATKTVSANTATDAELMANPNAPNTKISLTINAPEAKVNDQSVKLLVPAQIISGNTMVPLRFVGEAMGANVKWDGVGRFIDVTSKDAYVHPARAAADGSITANTSQVLDVAELNKSEQKSLVVIRSPKSQQVNYAYKGGATTLSNWDLAELKQLMVGGQAGVVKVLSSSGEPYTRTLDNYINAAYTTAHRLEILKCLGVSSSDADALALKLINNYVSYRKNYTQLIALLGVLCGNEQIPLDDQVRERVFSFLVNKLENGDPKLDANGNNILKRQCLLSLALSRKLSPEALQAVVNYYEKETNNYCLSPIAFFFGQHASDLRALPNGQALISRVEAVPSMYAAQVSQALSKGYNTPADTVKKTINYSGKLSNSSTQPAGGAVAPASGTSAAPQPTAQTATQTSAATMQSVSVPAQTSTEEAPPVPNSVL